MRAKKWRCERGKGKTLNMRGDEKGGGRRQRRYSGKRVEGRLKRTKGAEKMREHRGIGNKDERKTREEKETKVTCILSTHRITVVKSPNREPRIIKSCSSRLCVIPIRWILDCDDRWSWSSR